MNKSMDKYKELIHIYRKNKSFILIGRKLIKLIIIVIIFYKFCLKKVEEINYNNVNYYKRKGIKFLNKCKRNILTNKNKFQLNNTFPKISVIIPVYNCNLSIQLSISSIQNQIFKDFEIILVNDFSSDNSLEIIRKLQKKDKRIKIINNKKNKGTLFSRCIGVLKSKGKYIIPLDNDDLFMEENLFEKIYDKAEKNNYDIIEFKSFTINNYKPNIKDIEESCFNHHPNNLILHQPELGIFPISRNNKYWMNDFWIWAKCIKSKIYKESINALGEKKYSIYNCWTEDISIVFIIFNFSNSYIFLNLYGIFHLLSETTTSFKLKSDHRLFAEIFLLDIILDFSKNNEENKKYAVYKALDISKTNIGTFTIIIKIYLKSILKKLFKNKYIKNNDKILIKKNFQLILS